MTPTTTDEEIEEYEESDFRETADVLNEVFRLGYYSIVKTSSMFSRIGTYGSVTLGKDFDQRAEKSFENIVGFYHTHPPGARGMSTIDTRTAEAFAFSYGKRILMIIEIPRSSDTDHWYQGWYVDGNGIIANVRVLKIPFFHNHFLVSGV